MSLHAQLFQTHSDYMQALPMKTDTRGAAVAPASTMQSQKKRILAVCNVDLMAAILLKPWLVGLRDAGYEVHVACKPGEYFAGLAELGFVMHPIAVQRTFWPWAHLKPFLQLITIMREGDFSLVNTHSAVGGAIGRAAAGFVNCRPVIYTVHGFLFHENMPLVPRSILMSLEWLLGRVTDGFMFVSAEDHATATRTRIAPAKSRRMTILNGVDLDVFTPRENCQDWAREFKQKLGIAPELPVVGIIGRIVREKGYREFLEMSQEVIRAHKAIFMVIGDTLRSDRDQFGKGFRQEVERAGMTEHFLFVGHTNLVAEHLRVMDIFVLPSHREGYPRSIVEAMSAGLPVIATDIRGCREAVLEGKTGLIVPPKNARALAAAVARMLADPAEAISMGRAGRVRALELYDYRSVQRKFVNFVEEVLRMHQQ